MTCRTRIPLSQRQALERATREALAPEAATQHRKPRRRSWATEIALTVVMIFLAAVASAVWFGVLAT